MDLITFFREMPIVDEKSILIGATGVRGDAAENDHILARTGVEAISNGRPISFVS
jgi:uncharacterized protein GlcG (DUF336 family)